MADPAIDPGARRRLLKATAAALCCPAASAHAAWPPSAAPTREVTHALGRTKVPVAPARVITLFQGATDTTVGLGVTPVGVVESWTQKPVYPYLRDRLQGVAQVGLETQPSLEDIVMLAPDLIVASRFRNERIYSLLSRIAPTVALDDVFSFETSLATIAQALGRTEQAEILLQRWHARTARLGESLANAFGTQWPLTVSVLEFREDHVRAYMINSFSGNVLAQVGFTRSPQQSDDTQTLQKITSYEAIPLLNAQIIFILMRSDRPAVRQNLQQWQGHPLWARLDAVQGGRVYEVDNVAWSLAGGILGAGLMLDEIEHLLVRPA